MKKRDLSNDEKELWKEFSRSTKPLPHQNKKTQQRKPEKKKRINPVDLILVEGFKKENHPKIEAFRGINNLEPIALSDKTVLGIASDSILQNVADKPIFPLDDIPSISEFIITEVLQ